VKFTATGMRRFDLDSPKSRRASETLEDYVSGIRLKSDAIKDQLEAARDVLPENVLGHIGSKKSPGHTGA
jgi:hypothetical protein